MAAVWMVARSELRQRSRALLGLAVIVAVVTAVVLTALAGARRTETSFQRALDVSRASDVWVQIDDPEVATRVVEGVHRLPMVESAAGYLIAPTLPADAPEGSADFALIGDPSERYGVDVDRPKLVAGRLPSSTEVDEVLLTQTAARMFGLHVGDTMALQTFAPSDLEAIVTGDEFPGFNGPDLELVVVGIGMWPEEIQGRVQSAVLAGLVSPAFEQANDGIVGSWPITGMVRLQDPDDPDAVAALTDSLRELTGPDVEVIVNTAATDYVDAVQSAIDALATAILAFAAIALVAGLVVVGQAISRQTGSTAGLVVALAALGLPRRRRAATVLVPVAVASGAGVLVGAALSIAASPLLPLGLARRAEPERGLSVDPAVLLGGGSVLFVLVGAWAVLASWRAVRAAGRSEARHRPSWVATLLARGGARPVPVAGVRFAYEAGAGRTAVPVRAALVGGAIGVTGVVAVAVVAVSLTSLVGTPSRWGWTWSSRPDIYGEVDAAIDALVERDDIDAVAGLSYASVEVDGDQTTAYAIESIKGAIPFAILDGRVPSGPGEVALGQRTLGDLDRSVGDSVSFGSSDRSTAVELEIVGVASTPLVESTDPGRGVVLTMEGLDAVRQSDGSQQLLLRYSDGVDVAALESELNDEIGLEFPIYARPDPPGEVANLDQVRGLVALLAGFFVLLGAVGVTHALAVSVRRRRPDLGVLRALGFSRGQVRRTVGWQASTIAVTSSVVGVPLGIVLGRMVWRALVGDMGVQADPAQPWLVLLLIAPVTVVVALLAAWLPARAAARVRPATALRAE